MGIWLYPKGQHKYHTELTLREGVSSLYAVGV